jgi:perosamine synthetase
MTNVQAAIGVAQIERIDEILTRKRTMAAYYLQELADIPGLTLPVEKPYAKNVYWMFNILLTGTLVGKRSEFMRLLSERGVETREDFIPFNDQKIFIERGLTKPEDCPIASNAGVNGLYIPSGTDISEEEQAYVVAQMLDVVRVMGA